MTRSLEIRLAFDVCGGWIAGNGIQGLVGACGSRKDSTIIISNETHLPMVLSRRCTNVSHKGLSDFLSGREGGLAVARVAAHQFDLAAVPRRLRCNASHKRSARLFVGHAVMFNLSFGRRFGRLPSQAERILEAVNDTCKA